MNDRKTVIACGIFRRELEAVLPAGNGVDVHFLDAALHADAGRMKTALENAIVSRRDDSANRPRFLFGTGCHPDIGRIAEGCGSVALPVKNCIEAIAGPEKAKRLEANRTMLVTPAWIAAWPDIMEGLGWDEVDVRINLGRYDRIMLLDAGVAPVGEEEILSFYDLVQVPIEIEAVDLGYFKNLISQMLSEKG